MSRYAICPFTSSYIVFDTRTFEDFDLFPSKGAANAAIRRLDFNEQLRQDLYRDFVLPHTETGKMIMETHKPQVDSQGMVAEHDMACAACATNPAVLTIEGLKHKATFQPCWKCQERGYRLVKMPKFILKLYRWWTEQ